MATLLLIDGLSLAFRAFLRAACRSRHAEGTITNAV